MAKSLYKNIFLNKFRKKKILKFYCRSSSIPKLFLKRVVYLYKGNLFVRTVFTKFHINFKAGEFGITRKPFSFPIKIKKTKKTKR